MTSNANTNISFRTRLLALLDKHVVIPRVEKIFLAKSGREKFGRGEEHRDVNWSNLRQFLSHFKLMRLQKKF